MSKKKSLIAVVLGLVAMSASGIAAPGLDFWGASGEDSPHRVSQDGGLVVIRGMDGIDAHVRSVGLVDMPKDHNPFSSARIDFSINKVWLKKAVAELGFSTSNYKAGRNIEIDGQGAINLKKQLIDVDSLTPISGKSLTMNGSLDMSNHVINKVADGKESDDAVNLGQLNSAKTHYFSVHSTVSTNNESDILYGETVYANRDNDGAKGEESVAIGSTVLAKGNGSIVVGARSYARGVNGIAIGYETKSFGENTIVVGNEATSFGANSIALGRSAEVASDFKNSIAIGYKSQAGYPSMDTLAWSPKWPFQNSAFVPGNDLVLAQEEIRKYNDSGYAGYDYNTKVLGQEYGTINLREPVGVVQFGYGVAPTKGTGAAKVWVNRILRGVGAAKNLNEAVNYGQLRTLEAKVDTVMPKFLSINPLQPDAVVKKGFYANTYLDSDSKTTAKENGLKKKVTSGTNNLNATSSGSMAIGPFSKVDVHSEQASSVGMFAYVGKDSAHGLALGSMASVDDQSVGSVAIGYETVAKGDGSVALGSLSRSDGTLHWGYDPALQRAVTSYEEQDKIYGTHAAKASSNLQASEKQLHQISAEVSKLQKEYDDLKEQREKSNSSSERYVLFNKMLAKEKELNPKKQEQVQQQEKVHQDTVALQKETYGWMSQKGAVSLGVKDEQQGYISRQIRHVAAGTEDTDAVNLAQLKRFGERPLNIFTANANDLNNSTGNLSVKLGDTLKVVGKDGVAVKVEEDQLIIGLDAQAIKQNPDLKGPKGDQGPKGQDGLNGKDGKDGKDGLNGKDGKDGLNGKDGRGVKNVRVDDHGTLTVIYSDDTSENAGKVSVGNGVSTKISAGHNMKVTVQGSDYKIETSDDLTAQSLKITDGPEFNQNGVNMNGKKITNLAPGTEDSDAVTVGQMKKLALGGNVKGLIAVSEKKQAGRVAQVAALSALLPLDYDPEKSTQVAFGFGHQSGNSGVALGLMHYANMDTLFHAGVAFGSDDPTYRLGATFRLGSSSKYQSRQVKGEDKRLLQEIEILKETVSALTTRLDHLEERKR